MNLDECVTVRTVLAACGFEHLAVVFEKAGVGLNDLLAMCEEDFIAMPDIGREAGMALWKAVGELYAV